jgi:prolyl oligopeptidase
MYFSGQSWSYPVTHQVAQSDRYHGIEIKDPYRWLENSDSEETKAWVTAQNEVTFGYLAQIPAREKIKQRITELWDYEKFGIPFKRGDRYFYF